MARSVSVAVLLLSILVLASAGKVVRTTGEKDYGIMIDAGSTGSRIFLYEWPHRDNNTVPLVEPVINQTVVSMKNNIPLSSFANHPKKAGLSLEPLVKYILANLDPAKYATTPIYLKGTAGMRAINESAQGAILNSVRAYLATTPLDFQYPYATVIPGNEEGLLGWITTNFALHILQKMNPQLNTTGALDMGGASTQITFVPQSPPKLYGLGLNLGGIKYDIYAYSYAMGQDASLAQLLTTMIKYYSPNPKVPLEFPCFMKGFNESISFRMVTGTGNYTECVANIDKFLVTKRCSTCGVGSIFQPPLYSHFYAFSGFAYTFSFFGLPNTSSIADLQTAAQAFCDTPWQQLLKEYNTTDPSYLKLYCFTGAYFGELLTKGYGFSPESTTLTVQSSIGDIELSWALGGMIYEASLLPFGPTAPTPAHYAVHDQKTYVQDEM
jgi:apyrase